MNFKFLIFAGVCFAISCTKPQSRSVEPIDEKMVQEIKDKYKVDHQAHQPSKKIEWVPLPETPLTANIHGYKVAITIGQEDLKKHSFSGVAVVTFSPAAF